MRRLTLAAIEAHRRGLDEEAAALLTVAHTKWIGRPVQRRRR